MNPTNGLSVAIYARYSTDKQDERSIDDQLRRCREFATKHGHVVCAEYADAAQSGATMHREQMQKLLTDARRRGGAPFKAVLIDDLSRLSRDLGNTWRLIFEDLHAVNVIVIDRSNGQASDGEGARLMFGALALVNDQFLESVRKQTHRGLEGRALAGFWTGGKVYGYRTRTEEKPTDPEHPRHVVIVDDAQAAVVSRIFSLSAQGRGFASIAEALNADAIAPPYKPRPGRAHGWAASTVRAILLNERYIGRWAWNTSRFVRVPGKKNRRRISRPQHEWVVKEMPELTLVDRELWDAVHRRLEAERVRLPRGGWTASATRYQYLLGGLLRCGTCGGPMSVVSARKKKGERYARFGCSTHSRKGALVCANDLTVSERKVNAAVIEALRTMLLSAGAVGKFTAMFGRRLAKKREAAVQNAETTRLERDLATQESKVRNLTEAIGEAGWSNALGVKLKQEEERLQALKAKVAEAKTEQTKVHVLPTALVVEEYLKNLLATLERSPERGRELLRRHVGPLTLTPQRESAGPSFELTGAFHFLNLLISLGNPRSVRDSFSCGGLLCTFPSNAPSRRVRAREGREGQGEAGCRMSAGGSGHHGSSSSTRFRRDVSVLKSARSARFAASCSA